MSSKTTESAQEPPARERTRWDDLCTDALPGRTRSAGALRALVEELHTAKGGGERDALRALADASAELWPSLDAAERRMRALPRPASTGPLALVLRSMGADGRARQDAVAALSREHGPVTVSALALRTVDWVSPVRSAARAALLERLAGGGEADETAAAVRLLLRLRRRERAAGLLDVYRTVLGEHRHRATLRGLAADCDSVTRRFAYALADELGEFSTGERLETALRGHDQVCRRTAAESLLRLDPAHTERLLSARSAAVRELAVAALPDDVCAAALTDRLADRSRPVRAMARWKLYRRGEPPAAAYRDELRRCGRATPAALVAGLAAGLGECGDRSDVPMLTRLADREPLAWESAQVQREPAWPTPVRRSAVRALGRLGDAGTLLDVLVPLFADPAPSVAREALDALLPYASSVPGEVARTALARPEAPVRKAALRLLRAGGPWRRLEADLEMVAGSRPEAVTQAVDDLRGWLRQQITAPVDTEELHRLRTALHAARALPEDVARRLAFVLRAHGGRSTGRRADGL